MLRFSLSALLLVCSLFYWQPAHSVILDGTARVEVVLADGTNILLFGKDSGQSNRRPTEFYYLPANLQLAQYPDGTPQFLFLKFTEDKMTDPAQGALMHFLMTFGLTESQKNRVNAKLRKEYPGARVVGAVPLNIDEGGSFTITSGTVGQDEFIHSGRAPVIAGSRVAAATRMDATQAQLMDKTLQDMAIGDVSVSAYYTYQVMSPGVEARIDIDWSSFRSQRQSLEAEYTYNKIGGGLFGGGRKTRTYEEMRRDVEYLREQGIIKIQIDQYQDNEVTKAVTDAVMQYFLNASSQLAEPDAEMPPPAEEEQRNDPNIRRGHRYVYKQSFEKQISESKSQTMIISGRVPIRHAVTVTGNISDWYDSVKNNKRNVDTVVLNDPFFTIRPISFLLDIEAEDIFTEAVNFVTINVRKQRSSGPPFEDHLTIDRKYFENNGVTISTSYARGEDTNSDVFEYQTVWSIRGGGKYPANPRWERGDWESVALQPPVASRDIDIEADLDELRNADITRATVQIRYRRLGKELEENINLSPGEGVSLKSARVITDADSKGYAYRVILNHKREGKLALEWSPKVGDDYVYVSLPEDLQSEGSEIFLEAKQAGQEIAAAATDKILEQFDDLLN
jgi:hypothetical protein